MQEQSKKKKKNTLRTNSEALTQGPARGQALRLQAGFPQTPHLREPERGLAQLGQRSHALRMPWNGAREDPGQLQDDQKARERLLTS